METLKKIILKYGPPILSGRLSFSQEGEDAVIFKVLNRRKGAYLDIGCNHPYKNSNTYLFYKRGWQGVCIDPAPGTKKIFKKYRPRDLVFECGASNENKILKFTIFIEPLISTFDEVEVSNRLKEGYKISHVREIEVRNINDILNSINYTNFDLINIDVEGKDFEILKSINLIKYTPDIIIIEDLYFDIKKIKENKINIYMENNKYHFYGKTGNSLIYRRL